MMATRGLHRVSHATNSTHVGGGNEHDGRACCNDPKLERSTVRPRTELRPGRRRVHVSPINVLHLLACSMMLFSVFWIPAGATKSFEERRRARYGKFAMELPTVQLVDPEPRLFKPGDLVYDTRFPVHENVFRRRDGVVFGSDSANSANPAATATGAQTTPQRPLRFHSTAVASPASPTASILPPLDSSSSPSGAAPSSIVTAPGASSELPKPFDAGLGNNYTQPNCPVFINNFLRNDTFTSCLPFSLLLQNSMSFFQASKSMASISRTLDTTCNVVFPTCSSLMSSLADQLKEDENCSEDYKRQQPLVMSAYNGLLSYEPLYKAGCEKDEKDEYCFANAITNTSSPTDSYPYYLPLGIPLPGGSQPTCSKCLQTTMTIFNQAANTKNQQPLTMDYQAAAQMIDLGCGPNFANQTVTQAAGSSSSAASPSLRSSRLHLLSAVAVAVVSFSALIP